MKPVRWHGMAFLLCLIGMFCLLCVGLFARADDVALALVFVVPAQVALTGACLVLFVQRRFPESCRSMPSERPEVKGIAERPDTQ